MQRYSAEIKLFALDKRRSGITWREVQRNIEEKFKISPPSLRALEKWQKSLDREKLSQLIIEESKKALPAIEYSALQHMAEGLLPIIWQARDAGADMEREAWLWFFSVIERHLGESKFVQLFDEYRNRKHKTGTELGT